MPRQQLHETRPANGIARKLWDWATQNELPNKPAGTEPYSLLVAHPSRTQAMKGAGRYFLTPATPYEITFYNATEIRELLKSSDFTIERDHRVLTMYYVYPKGEPNHATS